MGGEKGVRLEFVDPFISMRTHEHAAAAAKNAGDTPVSARRILIADDYPNAAESLARWLRRMGNEVHTAVDGKEALEIAEKLRPEVVLLDLGMPKINGYEAAERIRSQAWGKEMVLVALTGWGQDEDRQRTGHAGFNIHLVKPIDFRKLKTLLETLEER